MARLNFEDSIFKDARFYKLVALCGNDLDTACGALLRAWSLAQKWYLTPSKMVPIPEWEKQGIRSAVIESGMATVIDGFVYVRGAKEQFAWLDQRSEAGRNGAKVTNEKKRTRKNAPAETIEESARRESSADRRATPSSSSSFSLSSSFSSSDSSSDLNLSNRPAARSARQPKTAAPKVETAETWESYRGAYLERYKVEPVRNATVNAQIKKFVERVGLTDSPAVISFYVRHNDSHYVKAMHPAGLLLRDAEGLRTQWARGRAVTGTDARTVERIQTNSNAFSAFSKLDGVKSG